jgi:selenocysteine-specific elongation factor
MYVIGTAGHVDHGKSALVAALTGTHPDRLAEEKAREMTIDLGFAWFSLPDGSPVGVVDVPGHRDFIENMLAGVGGIDAAILVIAADEGVMPQTREHLAILDLLQIPTGIVALTKCDLIEDAEWLDLVKEDIHNAIKNTVLSGAKIVHVSAKTKFGLDELTNSLHALLQGKPRRINSHRPRLSVDRVFSMIGFGTVVTGTLLDGSFHVGDEIVILPSNRKARIRGMQTHKTKEEFADPGQRTAVNLTGIDLEDVTRGDLIAFPGIYMPSRRFDAEIRLLEDIALPLEHHAEVKFFIGAKETIGRIRLIDQEILTPGKTGLVQLELRDEVVVYPGDRFIIRRPSPAETIGGGYVIHSPAIKRYKRFDPATVLWLNKQKEGDPLQRVFHAIQSRAPILLSELAKNQNTSIPQLQEMLSKVVTTGEYKYVQTGNTPETIYVLSERYRQDIQQKALGIIDQYHRENPLKPGVPREELKSRLNLPAKLFAVELKEWTNKGDVQEESNILRRSDFHITFSPPQQEQIKRILTQMNADPYSPPSVKEITSEIGEVLYQAMLYTNQLQQVSSEVVFSTAVYEKMVNETILMLQNHGELSLGQWRDQFKTSRKYAQAFLEYLDQIGITLRVGDLRKLKKSAN